MRTSKISGFYNLPIDERLRILKEFASLTDEELSLLKNSGALELERAERMIENVCGVFHIPLGIATNFLVNDKDYLVPMVVEEPSVVAAASHGAKLARESGGFIASADEPIMIGQVQLVNVDAHLIKALNERKKEIIEEARKHAEMIERYGGGVRDIEIRSLETKRGSMAVVYFYVDVRDAMGANIVNTILEGVAPFLEKESGGTSRARIISNLATERKARAKAVFKNVGNTEAFLDVYELAVVDQYRCATHNKGIMNGMDAIAVATGNDWRALEAGAHAYAAVNGYKPLTHYEKNGEDIIGEIELPIVCGIVGGTIGSNPIARVSLKILGVKTAKELAEVMAAVGLAQNFAALNAIAKEGIQKGHMGLHARSLALAAGARSDEVGAIVKEMVSNKNFSIEYAKQRLKVLRNE